MKLHAKECGGNYKGSGKSLKSTNELATN
nr:hypothetical protein Itr_chr14CG07240 [Ipomoea trifida]